MPTEHGFYYHFNDVKTGLPLLNIEVSPIDTAILLCGILTCRAHFKDPKITDLATQIYNRVDWPWMMNNGKTFALGWLPATGFLTPRWDHYAEMMMMYLLAIGSPTHPIDPSIWNNFSRPRMTFDKFNFISGHDPLFIHLYSHAWFDFYRKRDSFADYFANSVTAVRAHKAFCLSLNRGYNEDYWGVTASDWMHGYTAWGGPPLMGPIDGSVVPCATAGSLPFLSQIASASFAHSKRNTENMPGDAMAPATLSSTLSWYDSDVLGIDLGISLLMAENFRTGFVWKTFMQNPEALKRDEACRLSQLLAQISYVPSAAVVTARPASLVARPVFETTGSSRASRDSLLNGFSCSSNSAARTIGIRMEPSLETFHPQQIRKRQQTHALVVRHPRAHHLRLAVLRVIGGFVESITPTHPIVSILRRFSTAASRNSGRARNVEYGEITGPSSAPYFKASCGIPHA